MVRSRTRREPVIPGPSVLFVVGRALAHGRRTALATVLVFFAAVLPQFVNHAAGHLPVQMMALGLVPVVIGLITDTLWGSGAAAARSWLTRSERRLSGVGGAGGLALIGLGVTVAATGRAD
ncbi:lysine transporter LysE [Streptomyces noursei]|uniref:lysine transporter LysE n=1 Tax=Streptomyces noursei TaxID=1971 RepID=UPI0021A4F970|nr:lysine transporter LysE [Streptomyces noursei]UWS69930.1 lysine transporter LysE [Streptomyces noursei]